MRIRLESDDGTVIAWESPSRDEPFRFSELVVDGRFYEKMPDVPYEPQEVLWEVGRALVERYPSVDAQD